MPWTKMEPEDHEQVKAALRHTRQRRELSMADVDRLMGTSGNAMRQLEAGSAAPSAAMLFKLARAFDCSWDDLLGEPPGAHGDSDWNAGYRAGVGDAIAHLRTILNERTP